jgi:hypothetical protein
MRIFKGKANRANIFKSVSIIEGLKFPLNTVERSRKFVARNTIARLARHSNL